LGGAKRISIKGGKKRGKNKALIAAQEPPLKETSWEVGALPGGGEGLQKGGPSKDLTIQNRKKEGTIALGSLENDAGREN